MRRLASSLLLLTLVLGAPPAAAAPRAVVLDAVTLRVVDRITANGTVTAAVADGRGGWYVGGDFTRIAGARHASIGRLTATGGADPAFAGALTQHQTRHATGISALAVARGRLYVSGGFRFAGATHRPGLAAMYARTGRADRAFSPPPGLVHAAALVVHGRRLYVGDHTAIALGRRTGALVAGWRGAPGGFSEIGRVTSIVPAGARLLLGGTFLQVDGERRTSLAAVDERSGRVDRAWAPRLRSRFRICRPGPCIPVLAMARDGDALYVAGQFDAVDGVPRRGLVRLDAASGAVDRTWAPDVPARVQAIEGPLVMAGGRLLALADRHLVAFDLRTGTRRDVLPGRRIATVARSGDRVLVGLLPTAPRGRQPHPSIRRTTRAGTPATSTPAGTSLVTTDPAPTTESSPTHTPCSTAAPAPIHTLRSIRIGAPVMRVRRSAGASPCPVVMSWTFGPSMTSSPSSMPPMSISVQVERVAGQRRRLSA